MLSSSRAVFSLSRVAFSACVLVVASACRGGDTKSTATTTTEPSSNDSAGQVMFGVRAPLTHNSVTRGLVVADSGMVYDDGTRLELRKVIVTFIDENGLNNGSLAALAGTLNTTTSRLEARRQVVVTTPSGKKLQTERLVFDLANNLLVGDTAYQLTGAGATRPTATNGFEADVRLAKIDRPGTAAAARAKADSIAKVAADKAAQAAAKAAQAAAQAAAKRPAPAAKPTTTPRPKPTNPP